MPPLPESAVGEHRMRGVVPRRARHAAARMRAGTAQGEALERHAVIRGPDHRPGAEQLIETHLAMEDVAADQAEAALEIERRMDLAAEHRFGEARRMRIDRCDDLVGGFVPFFVPAAPRAEVE